MNAVPANPAQGKHRIPARFPSRASAERRLRPPASACRWTEASGPIPAGKNGFPGFKNKTSSPRRNPAGAVSVSGNPTRCKRGTRPARLRLTVQFPLLFSPSTPPLSLNLLYPQETITGWKKKTEPFPAWIHRPVPENHAEIRWAVLHVPWHGLHLKRQKASFFLPAGIAAVDRVLVPAQPGGHIFLHMF